MAKEFPERKRFPFDDDALWKEGQRQRESGPNPQLPHTEESREEEDRLAGREGAEGNAALEIPFWFTDIGIEDEDLEDSIKKDIIPEFNRLPKGIREEIVKQLGDEVRLGHLNDEDGKFDMYNVLERARDLVEKNVELVEKQSEDRS